VVIPTGEGKCAHRGGDPKNKEPAAYGERGKKFAEKWWGRVCWGGARASAIKGKKAGKRIVCGKQTSALERASHKQKAEGGEDREIGRQKGIVEKGKKLGAKEPQSKGTVKLIIGCV